MSMSMGMTQFDQSVIDLIESIRRFLIKSESAFAEPVLQKMGALSIDEPGFCIQNPNLPDHMKHYLGQGLQEMRQNGLDDIRYRIESAYDLLNWQVDDGLYYEKDADVGEAYTGNNMHCELIDPRNSFFKSPDFTLGIFVLGSHVLYRDHCHVAPEFYLNMTGPTQWRFNKGEWGTFEQGSMLWNDSGRVHATRVGDTPFISIYSWIHSITERCQVVDANDWDQHEFGHRP